MARAASSFDLKPKLTTEQRSREGYGLLARVRKGSE
jgi:hypothetical protein